MLVLFGLIRTFIHEQNIEFDSFIPKICSIAYNYFFLYCLPYCFKAVISIWMIATVQKSLTLVGFLEHCVDRSFVKKKGESQGSMTIQAVSDC